MRPLHYVLLVLLVFHYPSFSQCPLVKKRVYAARQETAGLGTVGNQENAVDANLSTYSHLSVVIGALNLINAKQFVEFRDNGNVKTIPANTPVTIKMGLPASLLGVLDNLTIQPFTGLNKPSIIAPWTATAAGSSYTLATVANLISAKGEVEITITPFTNYQGIWINLGSVLGVALSADIHEVYIEETDQAPSVDCNSPIDVLSGVKAGTVVGGIANATGSVTFPRNVIDNDDSSFATLDLGVQVLSNVYLTTIFKTTSIGGDQVELILQKENGGVLDLDLINGFTINAYNGSSLVKTVSSSSNLLNLQLLSGGTNDKYKLTATIDQAFDRIELSMGGLATAGLLSKLKVYEVRRIIAPPTALINTVDVNTPPIICAGNKATLTIANPQNCTGYEWFEDATLLTRVNVSSPGTTFVTPVLHANKTYYVRAIRTNTCSNASVVVPVPVVISPLPEISLGPMPEICEGSNTTSLIINAVVNNPTTYSILWDNTALSAGFSNVSEASLSPPEINITTTAIASGIYSGSIKVKTIMAVKAPHKTYKSK